MITTVRLSRTTHTYNLFFLQCFHSSGFPTVLLSVVRVSSLPLRYKFLVTTPYRISCHAVQRISCHEKPALYGAFCVSTSQQHFILCPLHHVFFPLLPLFLSPFHVRFHLAVNVFSTVSFLQMSSVRFLSVVPSILSTVQCILRCCRTWPFCCPPVPQSFWAPHTLQTLA